MSCWMRGSLDRRQRCCAADAPSGRGLGAHGERVRVPVVVGKLLVCLHGRDRVVPAVSEARGVWRAGGEGGEAEERRRGGGVGWIGNRREWREREVPGRWDRLRHLSQQHSALPTRCRRGMRTCHAMLDSAMVSRQAGIPLERYCTDPRTGHIVTRMRPLGDAPAVEAGPAKGVGAEVRRCRRPPSVGRGLSARCAPLSLATLATARSAPSPAAPAACRGPSSHRRTFPLRIRETRRGRAGQVSSSSRVLVRVQVQVQVQAFPLTHSPVPRRRKLRREAIMSKMRRTK